MAVEFELKFRCRPETQQQLRQELPGEETRFLMETTYYDTPDGDLSARRYTLRQRQENDTSVCTLKIPAAQGGRGEFEVNCPDIHQALPELCKLSGIDLAALTAKGLVPVCGAQFVRIAKTFPWREATIELALDRGLLTGGERVEELCEAELELKAGSLEDLKAYGAFVAAAYGLEVEERSKFRRALDLAKGENTVV